MNLVCKQLTLGEIIAEVEKCGYKEEDGEDKAVYFDFGTAIPTLLNSWRGSYSELALGYKLTGYDNNGEHLTEKKATDFLTELKSAIGKEFTGWKGGEYTMSEDTPVWVSNPGNASNTAIVGILNDGCRIIIITAYCKY